MPSPCWSYEWNDADKSPFSTADLFAAANIFSEEDANEYYSLPGSGIEQSPSNQDRLDAYAASSGTHLFSRPLPSNTGLGFARVADGSLYGAADNATATAVLVLSLKASDGSLNWRYQVADENVQHFLVAT